MFSIFSFQLTEKLSLAESELASALRERDNMTLEAEATVAARGAGQFDYNNFMSFQKLLDLFRVYEDMRIIRPDVLHSCFSSFQNWGKLLNSSW